MSLTPRCLLWLAITLAGLQSTHAQGQGNQLVRPADTNTAAAQSPSAAKVMELVPVNGVFSLTIRLQQVAKDPALSFMPWEIMSGATMDTMGVDFLAIERVDWLINWRADNQAGMAVIISTNGKVKLEELKPECFTDQVVPGANGRKYRALASPPVRRAALCQLSDTQFVIGDPALAESLLTSQPGPGPLREQMLRFGEAGHITAILTLAPAKAAILEAIQQAPDNIRTDIQTLVDKTQVIAAKSQVGLNMAIPIVMETASESDAQAVEQSWNRLVKTLVLQWRGSLRRFAPLEPDSQTVDPVGSYGARAGMEIVKQLTPARNGSRLTLKVDNETAHLLRGITTFNALLPGMAQTYAYPSGFALRSNQDDQNLKQIMLAVYNYESVYKEMPTRGNNSRDAKSLLSWRVALLPYLEQVQLYNKFKLDEPWDSEHNLALLKEMPAVYKVKKAKVQPGYTVIHVPTGPGLANEVDKRMRLREFLDGTSNTIYLALSTDEAAVPWTKPDEFNPIEHPELLRVEKEQYTFGVTDGSILHLPASITPEKLKVWFTRAGGEPSERQ